MLQDNTAIFPLLEVSYRSVNTVDKHILGNDWVIPKGISEFYVAC